MSAQPVPNPRFRTPVVAITGTCAPERRDYARRAARAEGHVLLGSEHIRSSPVAVEESVALLRRLPRSPGLVVEFPVETHAPEIIGELADDDGATCLTDLIAVVDAAHVLDDLRTEVQVPVSPASHEATGAPFVALAELLIGQLEYASAVVLTNASALRVHQLDRVMALLSHLNPTARLDIDDPDAPPTLLSAGPLTQEQTRPGWVSLLNGMLRPRFVHPEVGALRYQQHRPMHPGRLAEVVRRMHRGEFGTVLRSAGFCHLASRAHVTAHWEHVAEGFHLTPIAYDQQLTLDDEPLAFGQDLALIGLDMRRAALEHALDAAALTDEELIAGPRLWKTFTDPFPQWEAVQG